jgi:prepilin-type N-terminal cleavage/methylation domain-containing protein
MAGRSRTLATDEGLSLLEVVIAMLLFAVLALAILPLALQATKLSAANSSSASANAFASGQLAAVRAAFPDNSAATSCAAVRAAARTGVVDSAKTGLVADVTVAACPSTYPAAITVSVSVRASATSAEKVATMATKIVVTAS